MGRAADHASPRKSAATRISLAAWLCVVSVLCDGHPAQAQDSDGAPHAPAYAHDGVQLRVLAGPAYVYAFQDIGEEEASTISGAAAAFELSLGHMVGEALALNMDLALLRAGDAEHGVLQDTVFTAVHLGVGVTYWLMPANVYLSASLGAARSSVEGRPIRVGLELPNSDASDIGAGMHIAAGKQWWLGRQWGLGASISLFGASTRNPVGGVDSHRRTLAGALALTASFH